MNAFAYACMYACACTSHILTPANNACACTHINIVMPTRASLHMHVLHRHVNSCACIVRRRQDMRCARAGVHARICKCIHDQSKTNACKSTCMWGKLPTMLPTLCTYIPDKKELGGSETGMRMRGWCEGVGQWWGKCGRACRCAVRGRSTGGFNEGPVLNTC
jgi:hypothetical protein